MGNKEKMSNKLEDLKGQGKEMVGSATGDEDLVSEGTNDRLDSAVRSVKESFKDLEGHVKDAIHHTK